MVSSSVAPLRARSERSLRSGGSLGDRHPGRLGCAEASARCLPSRRASKHLRGSTVLDAYRILRSKREEFDTPMSVKERSFSFSSFASSCRFRVQGGSGGCTFQCLVIRTSGGKSVRQ